MSVTAGIPCGRETTRLYRNPAMAKAKMLAPRAVNRPMINAIVLTGYGPLELESLKLRQLMNR